jgi:hypothetical protein
LTQFDGALDLSGAFDFTGQALTFNAAGNSVGSAIDISNSGLFTTADLADISATGQFTQNGVGLNSLGGNLVATGGMKFATGVALTGSDTVTLATGGAAGQDIILGTDATTDITGAGQALTLNAGNLGDITINGDVGAEGASLGNITILGADQVQFDATVTAASFTQSAAAATGLTAFVDALNLASSLDFTGQALRLDDAVTVGASAEVTNAGRFTVDSEAGISVVGSLIQDGAGDVLLAVPTISVGDDINIAGALQIGRDVTLVADQSLVTSTIDSAVDGRYDLVFESRQRTKIGGAVGQSSLLGSLATGTLGEIIIDTTRIATQGDQRYNVPLTFSKGTSASPLELFSQAGDIEFASTVSAGVNAKVAQRSIDIEALGGNVFVRDLIGVSLVGVKFGDYASAKDINPYGLSIKAADIWLYADVTTFETQRYEGRVHIGNNGKNGFIRQLISLDPSVVFQGSIDDTVAMTHGLEVRAVTTDATNGKLPEIKFLGNVGQSIRLASVAALTGIQDDITAGAIASDVLTEPARRLGVVSIDGDVSTGGDQTYTAGSIDIGSNGGDPVALNSEYGVVSLVVRPDVLAGLRNGENLGIFLGKGATLSQETIDLIAQSGLSLASVVKYTSPVASTFSGFSDSDAGYISGRILAGQNQDQSSSGSMNGRTPPKFLLASAEVEVGDIQSQDEIGNIQSQEKIGDSQSQEKIGDSQSQEEVGDSQSQEEVGDSQSDEEVANDSESEDCASSADSESSDTETGGTGSGSALQC